MSNLHSPQKIAFVYDFLTTRYGGAEVVLRLLLAQWPEAQVFTSVADMTAVPWLPIAQTHTSFLQRLPAVVRYRHQWQALLAQFAFELFDFSSYDLVISMSSGPAKGVITLPRTLHINYLLAPTHHLYASGSELAEQFPWINWPVGGFLASQAFKYLRWVDKANSSRPDQIITLSKRVAAQSEQLYDRKAAQVIYPPFCRRHPSSISAKPPFDFVLCLSRLVWYKKINVAIQSALQMKKTLVVAGTGTGFKQLLQISPNQSVVRPGGQSMTEFFNSIDVTQTSIIFTHAVSDDEASYLLAHAQVFLQPGEEDFGMTALEAVSVGTPVLINRQSGVAEILTDPDLAIHIGSATVDSVTKAWNRAVRTHFSPALLKKRALQYSEKAFTAQFVEAVEQHWSTFIERT